MWPFSAPWWWGQRIQKLEEDTMTLQQDASDLKAALDGIAADVAPIKSGIDSLNANLAAALASPQPDPALLSAALDEAKGLKSTFDAMAASFAKAGAPIPETPNPAPAAPAASADGGAPAGGAAAGGDGGAPSGT